MYNERYDIAYYYSKSLNVVLSAIFEYEYIITDPRDGGGHWGALNDMGPFNNTKEIQIYPRCII